MDDHATGREQACCKAGRNSNLGSAPQGGSPTEPTVMKKMELGLSVYSWMNVWMDIIKKCMHSYTKMCLIPRTRVFISKPKKSQEENTLLRQKIKESKDKVDDLKSDAKRRKIISYNHIGLWWKFKKSVWNICFVLYCLSIFPINNTTCLPKRSYWMQAPTWLSD